MQQEPGFTQTGGIAVSTATGYEVPEGRGEFMNRNSLLLLIGQGVSLIGDGFYLFTVNVWLLAFLVGSATSTATAQAGALTLATVTTIILGAQYLAHFLILPIAGVFVDRWNRKTVMLVANVLQAIVALLPLAAYYGPQNLFLPTLYITFFVLYVLQGFFLSAELGAVQVIVSKRRAPQTISLFQTLIAVGTVLGALYSGTFFISTGPLLAIGLNAFSFLVSAIFIFFMRVPREALHPYAYRQGTSGQGAGLGTGIGHVLKELGIGVRFIFTVAVLVGLIIMLVVAQIGAGAVNGLYSGFFVLNLHGNPVKDAALLNVLPAAFGAGVLIGSLLAGLVARFISLKLLTALSIILLGLNLLVFSVQSALLVGVIVFTIGGIFEGSFTVGYTSLIVKVSPQIMVGRVNAAVIAIVSFSSIITSFGIAQVVSYYNPLTNPTSPFAKNPAEILTLIFAIAALFIALGGIVGLVIFLRAKEGSGTTTAEASVVTATSAD